MISVSLFRRRHAIHSSDSTSSSSEDEHFERRRKRNRNRAISRWAQTLVWWLAPLSALGLKNSRASLGYVVSLISTKTKIWEKRWNGWVIKLSNIFKNKFSLQLYICFVAQDTCMLWPVEVKGLDLVGFSFFLCRLQKLLVSQAAGPQIPFYMTRK